MNIVIYSVNNQANQETARHYCEEELLERPVRMSDNFSAANPDYKLIISKNATKKIFDFIEWHIGQRPDTRIEQGGVLIGHRYCDKKQNIHFVIVDTVVTAKDAYGSSGYLEITHECWDKIHKEKDLYNEEHQDNAVIVGWFHTHPNMLSCFMSGTDRTTQSQFFDGENTYSVVINPQRHLLKAFRGKECYATQAFLLGADED